MSAEHPAASTPLSSRLRAEAGEWDARESIPGLLIEAADAIELLAAPVAADESLFADSFPRIEELRTENILGDVAAKDIAWLCEVAEAAARLCVYLSRVEPMQFKRSDGCNRWNRLAGLLQPHTDRLIFPEGDERCGFVMDACTCMKRKGHEGLHSCAHGVWRG